MIKIRVEKPRLHSPLRLLMWMQEFKRNFVISGNNVGTDRVLGRCFPTQIC